MNLLKITGLIAKKSGHLEEDKPDIELRYDCHGIVVFADRVRV